MGNDLKVWTRFGDTSDYGAHDTPYKAGYELGNILNPDGSYTKEKPELQYRSMGVELEGFIGNNYVSLYWGDYDAQPVGDADLNASDRLDFEQGIYEGLNG